MIQYPKGYIRAKKAYRRQKIYLAAAIILILLGSTNIIEANEITDFVREVAVQDEYC